MIELATAALIAKLVSDAVNSFDKIYRGYADWVEKKTKATEPTVPPPDLAYVDQPSQSAFVAQWRSTGGIARIVTYEELREKLGDGDREHIESLSRAMNNYEKQWNAAFVQRSLATGMEIGKMDAQLEYLAKQISETLVMVLQFVNRMGFGLDDHYVTARSLAERYLQKA